MPPSPFHDALLLTGPTGSGKSALALKWAEQINAEIVSMDSMALYRGLDIGTAKPTMEDRRRVRHHLIDVLEPWESASVAWWLEQAAVSCQEIRQRGKRPLIVGGTPLYLKAVLFGLFDGPPADAELRKRLTQEAERSGPEALHARLAQADPVSANRLHPNDLRRVIRALEVAELTGQPMSVWQTQWRATEAGQEYSKIPVYCLEWPREQLYQRIDQRVHAMMAAGLVEEVRTLRQLPQPLSPQAAQALGYKEVFAYLDGEADLQQTVTKIQTRSRNFAKRQLTWFRHLPNCQIVNPGASEGPATLMGRDLAVGPGEMHGRLGERE